MGARTITLYFKEETEWNGQVWPAYSVWGICTCPHGSEEMQCIHENMDYISGGIDINTQMIQLGMNGVEIVNKVGE